MPHPDHYRDMPPTDDRALYHETLTRAENELAAAYDQARRLGPAYAGDVARLQEMIATLHPMRRTA
jgi:hypothetical protein